MHVESGECKVRKPSKLWRYLLFILVVLAAAAVIWIIVNNNQDEPTEQVREVDSTISPTVTVKGKEEPENSQAPTATPTPVTTSTPETTSDLKGPTLTYIGHASIKLKTSDGKVIYIDPYYSEDGYEEPADYILVTHIHDDHNQISKCKQNKGCQIIKWSDAVDDKQYKTFEFDNIKIEAVPSGGNSNHYVWSCTGYIVTIDGVSVYHAGDTSMSDGLKQIVGKKIDYAMYPVDGTYNMGPEEATEVADMIGATHNIPIHGIDKLYKLQFVAFHAKGKMVMNYGQTIALTKEGK